MRPILLLLLFATLASATMNMTFYDQGTNARNGSTLIGYIPPIPPLPPFPFFNTHHNRDMTALDMSWIAYASFIVGSAYIAFRKLKT